MDDKTTFETLPVVEKTEFDANEFPDEIGNKYADIVNTDNKENSNE